MTLADKLLKIEEALTAIPNLAVYHYLRPQLSAPFCVWQEDSETASLESDDHKGEQAIGGSIDYFTKTEYDSMVDEIQEALNSIEGCGWMYNSVQYEDETNLIHHEWVWRII